MWHSNTIWKLKKSTRGNPNELGKLKSQKTKPPLPSPNSSASAIRAHLCRCTILLKSHQLSHMHKSKSGFRMDWINTILKERKLTCLTTPFRRTIGFAAGALILVPYFFYLHEKNIECFGMIYIYIFSSAGRWLLVFFSRKKKRMIVLSFRLLPIIFFLLRFFLFSLRITRLVTKKELNQTKTHWLYECRHDETKMNVQPQKEICEYCN